MGIPFNEKKKKNTWKAHPIHACQEKLFMAMERKFYILGNGRRTPVWDHPWIPMLEGFTPTAPTQNDHGIHRVSDLINSISLQCDRENFLKFWYIKNLWIFSKSTYPHTNTFGLQIAQGNSQQNLLISYQNPNLDSNCPLTNRNWNAIRNAKFCIRFKLMPYKIAWDVLP